MGQFIHTTSEKGELVPKSFLILGKNMPGKIPPFNSKLIMRPMITRKNILKPRTRMKRRIGVRFDIRCRITPYPRGASQASQQEKPHHPYSRAISPILEKFHTIFCGNFDELSETSLVTFPRNIGLIAWRYQTRKSSLGAANRLFIPFENTKSAVDMPRDSQLS